MNNKINYKIVLSILFVSLLLGLIYNAFSSDGIPFIREKLIVNFVSIDSSESSSKVLKGLHLEQVLTLHKNNTATFIDSRDQWDFSEGRIMGAINIPEFSFTPEDSTLSKIDKDAQLVVYCDGDDCDISKRLTNKLMILGYKNTYVFLGGIKEWADAELPIEKGDAYE